MSHAGTITSRNYYRLTRPGSNAGQLLKALCRHRARARLPRFLVLIDQLRDNSLRAKAKTLTHCGWDGIIIKMVLRYAHLAPDHLSHAAARIERPLGIV